MEYHIGNTKRTLERIRNELADQEKEENAKKKKYKGGMKWIPAHRTSSGVRFGYWRRGDL